jgi:hypothetical protein
VGTPPTFIEWSITSKKESRRNEKILVGASKNFLPGLGKNSNLKKKDSKTKRKSFSFVFV